MDQKRICKVCNSEFISRHKNRAGIYCSKKCEGQDRTLPPNTTCTECGYEYHIKPYRKGRAGKLGYFCSVKCLSAAKKRLYAGESNPNYRNKTHDDDGYRICAPYSSEYLKFGAMKLHRALCCEVLGLDNIPTGFHVHHRDCDPLNNVAENLVVLNVSDHKWIHKQYGLAPLWAYCKGKIGLETMVSWSNDHERARRLLPLNVNMQISTNDNEKFIGENNELAIKHQAA